MKKNIFITTIMILISFMLFAQNDTLYIMKDGQIAGKYHVLTEIDSMIFYRPEVELPANSFIDDRDGTIYTFVTIGNQVWMAENLKYLPEVSGPESGSSTSPRYYVYDYDGTNAEEAKITEEYEIYGVLYNWRAAMAGESSSESNPSGVQGVCPTGWHLPSSAEWDELADFLGGAEIAGGKMKSTGTIEAGTGLWYEPNTQATNESGFTGLPGGFRWNSENIFGGKGYNGNWWSSTQYGSSNARWRNLATTEYDLYGDYTWLEEGYSVRCIKD